jgi:hypothetical protein
VPTDGASTSCLACAYSRSTTTSASTRSRSRSMRAQRAQGRATRTRLSTTLSATAHAPNPRSPPPPCRHQHHHRFDLHSHMHYRHHRQARAEGRLQSRAQKLRNDFEFTAQFGPFRPKWGAGTNHPPFPRPHGPRAGTAGQFLRLLHLQHRGRRWAVYTAIVVAGTNEA